MFVTLASNVEGYETLETLGLVKGNTVRVQHLGRDVLAVFKNITGGEIEKEVDPKPWTVWRRS